MICSFPTLVLTRLNFLLIFFFQWFCLEIFSDCFPKWLDSSKEQGNGAKIKPAKTSSWEIFVLFNLDHKLPNRHWWGHGSQFFIFLIFFSPFMSKMEIQCYLNEQLLLVSAGVELTYSLKPVINCGVTETSWADVRTFYFSCSTFV